MIGSLAPWFGSKRTLAPRIVEALGPHKAYWEPFCGSMAVLLAKEPCRMETVNDLNGDLINLSRTIQDATLGPQLYRRLRRVLMHESEQEEAKAKCREKITDPVERAYWYFINSWMVRNGYGGTKDRGPGRVCVRFTNNGGHAATRWAGAVASIPQWRERLRKVTILQRDAFELIPRIEDVEETAIYCDPPYVVKGAKYLHDFESADHARLAETLQSFRRARVVVSYYDHPDLNRLYPGWSRLDCTMAKAVANASKTTKGAATAPEILLINTRGAGGLFV